MYDALVLMQLRWIVRDFSMYKVCTAFLVAGQSLRLLANLPQGLHAWGSSWDSVRVDLRATKTRGPRKGPGSRRSLTAGASEYRREYLKHPLQGPAGRVVGFKEDIYPIPFWGAKEPGVFC